MVAACGCNPRSIGAEAHAADVTGVSPERVDFLTCGSIPQFDFAGLGTTFGCNPRSIGAEAHAVDRTSVSPERTEFLTCDSIPQFDFPQFDFAGLATSGGCNPRSIGAESPSLDTVWLTSAFGRMTDSESGTSTARHSRIQQLQRFRSWLRSVPCHHGAVRVSQPSRQSNRRPLCHKRPLRRGTWQRRLSADTGRDSTSMAFAMVWTALESKPETESICRSSPRLVESLCRLSDCGHASTATESIRSPADGRPVCRVFLLVGNHLRKSTGYCSRVVRPTF